MSGFVVFMDPCPERIYGILYFFKERKIPGAYPTRLGEEGRGYQGTVELSG